MPMMTKNSMGDKERLDFELKITREYIQNRDDTKRDLSMRMNGVAARNGSSGKQFAGYTTLERFYRGDQWDHDEQAGASQRTDNYCAVVVDNMSSLVFDDVPEIHCPTDDPTDDLLAIKSEMKEKLLMKVWEENGFEVEFDEWAKVSSLYGDGFLKGPWIERTNEFGKLLPLDDKKGFLKIRFAHVENPASIQPIYADASYKRLIGFIDRSEMSYTKALIMYGDIARSKGITISASIQSGFNTRTDPSTNVPMVNVDEYWKDDSMSIYINDKLLDYYFHNWGFVPLHHVKNIYIPNHPFGKSDLEDLLDPQLSHNTTNNDLANFLKWVSTVNLWGKNIETMQAIVAGASRIYSVPDDGELHAFEKTGDPYIANTYVQQRRGAILDISGVSEALMSSSQIAGASGRALALAFQGTVRKLNPRIKRFRSCLQDLNAQILRLMEIYFPATKVIIDGDYRSKVFIPATLFRNIIDTINKLQSGIISQETAMREAGVQQPKMEKKLMKKDLEDPVLGPQIARQPSLLPRLTEGQNQPGEGPMQGPGNRSASQAGAVASQNQNVSGAAPTPVE